MSRHILFYLTDTPALYSNRISKKKKKKVGNSETSISIFSQSYLIDVNVSSM